MSLKKKTQNSNLEGRLTVDGMQVLSYTAAPNPQNLLSVGLTTTDYGL